MHASIKRLAVTAAVSGAITVFGLGPVAGPAFAGPQQECDGEVVHGGGPPRCVESEPGNGNHTVVTTSQWSGGHFEVVRSCTYNNNTGALNPGNQSGCPSSI